MVELRKVERVHDIFSEALAKPSQALSSKTAFKRHGTMASIFSTQQRPTQKASLRLKWDRH
jgi:hypothetical protein